jgi:glutathione peroxidase
MSFFRLAIPFAAILVAALFMKDSASAFKNGKAPSNVLDFTMKDIDGKPKPLADYKGKVVMIVNVASKCGYTPQYAGLEQLYEKYKDRGFIILGFPANNFGSQEPGTESEIKTFCSTKYDVKFDMFSKISVKGDDMNSLYRYITNDPVVKGDVKWNFQKYLVDRSGKLVAKYLSPVTPMDSTLTSKVEELLGPAAAKN